MSQLAHPLAASSAEESVSVTDHTDAGTHPVSFAELVAAHFDWWKARDTPDAAQIRRRYDAARIAFESRHGEVVSAYWCSHVESAVALTERRRARGLLRTTWGFHRESDWATKTAPEVAGELHRCDELAVRASAVLTGVRQRICMRLVVAAAAHLLSLVDARASHGDPTTLEPALAQERLAIDHAERYYRSAANGQAQMVYFGGMASIAVVVSLASAIWLSISWDTPVAALIAGAVGAVVSVIQRINTGKFTLEYDVGSPYAFFLGGLRPLIGGTFALAISFAFTGGLLHLPVSQGEATSNRHLALLVIGFLAGFSERWAQDTLTAIVPAGHEDPPETTAPTVPADPPPQTELPKDGV